MRRTAGGDDEGAGTLEIEFEDGDESPESGASPAGRPRDLRPAALITLAVAVLAAGLAATHHVGSRSAGGPTTTNGSNTASVTVVAPDYAAFVVTVGYEGSRLLSLPQRLIEVDLRITPVPGAKVTLLNYYVSDNGVVSSPEPALFRAPLPTSGVSARLDLTVTDCAVVPIGESMSFVDVVADGPPGVTDRFTILGQRYSADLARLLRAVCPSRAGGQNPLNSPGRVTGS